MYYAPEPIDFNCFFMATKHSLGDLCVHLNPYTQKYFKIKDLYVALTHQPDEYNLHIDMMAGKGGLGLFEQVRIIAKKCDCNSITWITSVNNTKVNKLAKFYKCKIMSRITGFYPDGSDAIIYQLDIG